MIVTLLSLIFFLVLLFNIFVMKVLVVIIAMFILKSFTLKIGHGISGYSNHNLRLFATLKNTDSGDVYLREEIDDNNIGSSVKSPVISWYPGHIAKAERELSDYLKKVDVVIEVRDARIPLSTTHPMVPEWVGNKPLIIAIARLDQISKQALIDWREYYTKNPPHPERPDAKV